MLLKAFYTSIHSFLPHQLSCPSIHATFKTHKWQTSIQEDYAVHAQSHSKRHHLASLKTTLIRNISLFNKLRQSNLNTVN